VSPVADVPKDWVRRPPALVVGWRVPILLAVTSAFLRLPLTQAALLWTGLFAWMGTGCVLNALRCARLHCYICGPVLWLGAAASVLIGLGVVSGHNVLNDVIGLTTALVVLSYVPGYAANTPPEPDPPREPLHCHT
jgi:hypothetical protein